MSRVIVIKDHRGVLEGVIYYLLLDRVESSRTRSYGTVAIQITQTLL